MKKVALINDLSSFGKCSLTAAIPVISVMGLQACPLPTAILSAQTGFESYFYDDYTDRMNCFTDEWKKMQVSFDGIASGFLAGKEQIDKVLYFLKQFKTKDTIYLLDPVLGDHGKMFSCFSNELLVGMRKLAEYADVMTPNLTELCLLAGEDYEKLLSYKQEDDYIERIGQVCQKLLLQMDRDIHVIVTGIIREKENREYVSNLIVSKGQTSYVESPYTGQSFSGTGDLFASVVCGAMVKGVPVESAVKKAVDFLQEAIEDATVEKIPRNHGVQFEKYLYRLIEGGDEYEFESNQ